LKNQEYYEDKIKHVNGRIRLEKERRLENSDDEATAYEKYNRAMRIFQAKQDQIDEIASTSKTMDNDLAMRRKRWVEFRDFISAKANLKFNAVRKFTLQIECLLVVDFLISWVSIYST
jgi:hypothetical protein